MNIKKISLFLVSVFFFISTQAQYGRKMRDSEIDQMNSERQIKELKENVLLVRLRTRQPVIDALVKAERNEEAKKVELHQLQKNQEIIAAFDHTLIFVPCSFLEVIIPNIS